jgi:hypothetical protein
MDGSYTMNPRLVGILALLGGLLLAVVAGAADYLGVGGTASVIGDIQWIGITAGAILFILGLTVLLLTMSEKSEKSHHA